jgi:hypothetical protein
MQLRGSSIYLGTITALALTLAGICLHASREVRKARPVLSRKAALVRQLELTDLCLFTEASYTRHLSMTDPSTPFQDSPLSLEHFPSGGLVEPPLHLMRNRRD